MKKTTMILMACLIAASSAFALTPPETTSDFVVINSGRTLKVIYKAHIENDVKIIIRNSGSQEVFTETLRKTDSFLRPYNLSQLPEGEYSVEIIDNNGLHRKPITINSATKGLFHVVPVTGEKGKYLLTIGKMKKTKVNILVKNQFDEVLFESTRNADEEFGQIINVTRVKGATIVITDSNGVQKTFSL